MAEGESPNGPEPGGPQPTRTERGPDEGQIQTFLIADIRGYTRFSQEHGDEAAGRLAERYAQVITEVIEAQGGAVIELTGDEALCVFPTTRRAIRAAIELQTRFVAETTSNPALPLPVGIGIDTGEAVPVGGGFRGRALNMASRLCAVARAGEILATREAIHMAGSMAGTIVEDRGLSSFKNMPEPVSVMRVAGDGEDPAQWFAARTTAPTKRLSARTRSAIAALATLLVAVSVAAIATRSSGSTAIDPNSVGILDPQTGEVTGVVDLGARPGALVAAGGNVWVAKPDAGSVVKIDPVKNVPIDTVPVGEDPTALAVGDNAVWVVNSGGPSVSRISLGDDPEVVSIPVGNGPSDVAVGFGSVWVTNRFDGTVSRIDLASRTVAAEIPVGLDPDGIGTGFGSVWVALAGADSVARIDPRTNDVRAPIGVGNAPRSLAVGGDSVWVANTLSGTVMEIQPMSESVVDTITVGREPSDMAIVGSVLWVASAADGALTRIDADREPITIPTGSIPQGLADVGGDLWVTARGTSAPHVGGTLRVVSESRLPTLDSAGADDANAWLVPALTSDGLVAFKKIGGSDGASLVADLATAIPTPSDDGRTYAFTLREGIPYSTGEVVSPSDFQRALERSFRLTMGGVGYLYEGLVGGDACAATPTTCDLSDGIDADDTTGTITFHLAAPDPDFLFKLAIPYAFPVPPDTPDKEQIDEGIPGTGPYMVDAPMTPAGLVLVRNPYFHAWSDEAQPAGNVDRIEWTFGVVANEQVGAVIDGDADLAFDGVAASQRLDELAVRFPSQLRSIPWTETWYVTLNTTIAPFNDVRVRRALNYAVDRRRAVEIVGGDAAARPTCQQLPPNFPGYVPFCPYTIDPGTEGVWTAPDFDKAKELVMRSGTADVPITLEHFKGWDPLADYLVELLRRLGYQAKTRQVGEPTYYGNNAYQMRLGGMWSQDFPAASNFIVNFFTCHASETEAFSPGFCDPRIDAMIDRSLRVQVADPSAAGRLWSRVDKAIALQAPYLWLVTPLSRDFVSARVGNYQSHPLWGMLLSQAWVQ